MDHRPLCLLRPLTEISVPEQELIRRAYIEAFPPDEQRPWAQIIEPNDLGLSAYVIDVHGDLSGLITFWKLDCCLFVEHLVTLPHLRGRGVGTYIINWVLREAQGCPLVLEAEPHDVSELASRRLGFYARLGLHPQPYDYIQPAYTSESQPVRLHLLSSNPLVKLEFEQIRDAIYSVVYGYRSHQ